MAERLGAADPRLADSDWLARAYAEHGDMWIALETGAARGTVRRARRDLGITSRAVGRRRGAPSGPAPASPVVADRSLDDTNVRKRLSADRRHRDFALGTLADHVRAVHAADLARDTLAFEAALLDLASCALVAREHSRDLRRAT